MEYQLITDVQRMALLRERLQRLEAQHMDTLAGIEAQQVALAILEAAIERARTEIGKLNGAL